MVLIVTTFYAGTGFGGLFVACELSQRMSNGFDEINDEADQLNWHQFPVEIQKLLPTIMANVQQPVEIECFGSISCCRMVFIKVSHTEYGKSNSIRMEWMPKRFHSILGGQSWILLFYCTS